MKSFVALFVLILAFCVQYGIQAVDVVGKNIEFEKVIANTEPAAKRASIVINTMVAVGNDILAIADTNPVAREIVRIYKIRSGNVPEAPEKAEE